MGTTKKGEVTIHKNIVHPLEQNTFYKQYIHICLKNHPAVYTRRQTRPTSFIKINRTQINTNF